MVLSKHGFRETNIESLTDAHIVYIIKLAAHCLLSKCMMLRHARMKYSLPFHVVAHHSQSVPNTN